MNTKKILGILAVLAVLAVVCVGAAGAADVDVWDGTIASGFAGGDGTEGNPYQISTGAQLAYLAKSVNEKTLYTGQYFKLTNDINLSAHNWVPIEAYDNGSALSGVTIDGNNHTIFGMKIEVPAPESGYVYGTGFIGKQAGTLTVKNLTFSGCNVSSPSGSQVGIIVGMTYGNLNFTNVHIEDSTVLGCTKTGAFVGQNDSGNPVSLTDCTLKTTTVKANYSFALFVGLLNINNDGVLFTNVTADDQSRTEWIEGESKRGVMIKGRYYEIDGDELWLTDPQNAWAERRIDNDTLEYDGKTYKVKGSVFVDGVAKIVDENGTRIYSSIGDAIVAAQSGDTITLLQYVDDYSKPVDNDSRYYRFTKDADGEFYYKKEYDDGKKTGRLVYLKINNPGSKTSRTTFDVYVGKTAKKQNVKMQTILLDSESRLDAKGSLLKSGDIVLLPGSSIYDTTDSEIVDVYGDITFVGTGEGNTVIYPLTGGSSYRYMRLYDRYADDITNKIIRHFNFKNLTFDGGIAPTTGALNAFVVTCYNIEINADHVTFKNFKGSVFSVWANDTLTGKLRETDDYPNKADNVGVTVNLKNVTTENNGRLIHFDCSPYQSRDIDERLDRFAFIHLNYDASSTLNDKTAGNSIYTQAGLSDATYDFNTNTALGQNNCLINDKDVSIAGCEAKVTKDGVDTYYSTLKEAIAAVPVENAETVTIELLKDVIVNSINDKIAVNKNNVIVDGKGKTITVSGDENVASDVWGAYKVGGASQKYGQFDLITVSGTNVVMKNLTLDGKDLRGLSLAVTKGGSNVTYENITYNGRGSGHYYGYGGPGTITFKDCTFNTKGYAIHCSAEGSKFSVVIDNCVPHGWNSFGV